MRAELGISDSTLVITYAGTLGEAQGLSSLVEALGMIDGDVVCLLAGSGTAESSLRRQAEGNPRVRFLGRLPFERMPDLMATTDLGYISLSDHPLSPITMPSKTQANLAAGVPLLVSAPGDLARLVREHRVGLATPPQDAKALSDAIIEAARIPRSELKSMGARARDVYEQHFSLDRGVAQFETLLQQAADKKAR